MDSYRRRNACIFPFIILLVLSSCTDRAEVTRAFYYWRSGSPEPEERTFLREHHVQKIYARLMDVDWSEVYGPIPVSTARVESFSRTLNEFDSLNVEMIPVVFITNKTFERIDTFDIPQLAKRLVRRCLPAYDDMDKNYEARNSPYYGDPIRPKEIQFDCDWTVATAKKYFQFLEVVKNFLPSDSIRISATIRLHQYKYYLKTGVPPVDRGMLMMYNISDPKKYSTDNSIFETDKAAGYFTQDRKYPLPLDIALPTWSWCIVFRNQEFYQIENGLSEEELKKLSFLQPKGNHFYKVTKDTVYRDLFLRPGDEIKAESISHDQLQQAATLAKKAVNTDQFTVTFFELNYNDIKQFPDETFEKLYTGFR